MPSLEMPQSPRIRSKVQILEQCQIFAFLSISYPKLRLKVMQNIFRIGHLSAKLVKIVAMFYLYRGKIQILSSLLP